MKHKETLNSVFNKLKAGGVRIDAHHHTHSPYKFDEDGIAINRGDWLKNEYCRKTKKGGVSGVCTVISRKRLDSLLLKQGLFERVCGYATTKAQLLWYVMEYYCSSIDYIADFDDNIEWKDIIGEAVEKAWNTPLEEIDVEPMRDRKKVKLERSCNTQSEVASLSNKGVKKYNESLIDEFMKRNPGQSKYWYIQHHKEIGLGKNTVKRYLYKKD